MDAILVVNAGSSSLKFQIFNIVDGKPEGHIRGQLDGIGVRPRLRATAGERMLVEHTYKPADVPDLPAAVGKAREWLASLDGVDLRAIGHRVVHGGPDFDRPILIDETVLDRLAGYQELAPLHQPNNLAPIRLVMDIDRTIPQAACFDTAFHRGRPESADCYALPRSLYEQGVRRYGFHGLSYEYIAERLGEIAPGAERVIVAHLGSGASMCAMRGSRSIESTMGFTALDGLPMGTRPGQLDPGVVLYLMQQGMSHQAVSDLLHRGSGLKGLSGISNDVRDLLASSDPRAKLAMDHFVYRCGLSVGLLVASLGGLDAFVFTAGIGENSAVVRTLLSEKLAWLGVKLDDPANEAGKMLISAADSRVQLLVVPTNEELMIARHTLAVVGAR